MASQIRTRGGHQYVTVKGQNFKRRVGATDWTKAAVEAPPEEDTKPSIILAVMALRQAPGEPDHWLLFFGPEDGEGFAFQVTGDAINMHYQHTSNVNIIASDSFQWAEVIQRDVTASSPIIQRLSYWATQVPPPSAQSQAQVTENCQGWVLKVLARLVSEGLLPIARLQSIDSRKQPLQL